MRSFNILLALAIPLTGLCDVAPDLKGVYDVGGGRQLVLCEQGLAAVMNRDAVSLSGFWDVKPVEGADRVVVRLRDEMHWQVGMDKKVIILDVLPNDKGLRVIGAGRMTLDEAVRMMREHANDAERPPPYPRQKDSPSPSLAAEIKANVNKMDEPRRRREAHRQEAEAEERLMANTKLLRNVKFKYPELDPEESLPDVESIPALYPQSMRLVFELLANSEVKIDKETLEGMLDRVDWDRGDVLAFTILRRDELDAGSLRKYAKQALARIGKSDRKVLSWYLNRSDLPQDILEAAVKAGWSK